MTHGDRWGKAKTQAEVGWSDVALIELAPERPDQMSAMVVPRGAKSNNDMIFIMHSQYLVRCLLSVAESSKSGWTFGKRVSGQAGEFAAGRGSRELPVRGGWR